MQLSVLKEPKLYLELVGYGDKVCTLKKAISESRTQPPNIRTQYQMSSGKRSKPLRKTAMKTKTANMKSYEEIDYELGETNGEKVAAVALFVVLMAVVCVLAIIH